MLYLGMVVGNNESATTKNAGKSLAILIAMQMRQYNVGHIVQKSTSRIFCAGRIHQLHQ